MTSLLFLDELALKDDGEKQAFFQRLPTILSTFPDQVCKYKILPILMNALEFGIASGNLVVLSSVLDVGARCVARSTCAVDSVAGVLV